MNLKQNIRLFRTGNPIFFSPSYINTSLKVGDSSSLFQTVTDEGNNIIESSAKSGKENGLPCEKFRRHGPVDLNSLTTPDAEQIKFMTDVMLKLFEQIIKEDGGTDHCHEEFIAAFKTALKNIVKFAANDLEENGQQVNIGKIKGKLLESVTSEKNEKRYYKKIVIYLAEIQIGNTSNNENKDVEEISDFTYIVANIVRINPPQKYFFSPLNANINEVLDDLKVACREHLIDIKYATKVDSIRKYELHSPLNNDQVKIKKEELLSAFRRNFDNQVNDDFNGKFSILIQAVIKFKEARQWRAFHNQAEQELELKKLYTAGKKVLDDRQLNMLCRLIRGLSLRETQSLLDEVNPNKNRIKQIYNKIASINHGFDPSCQVTREELEYALKLFDQNIGKKEVIFHQKANGKKHSIIIGPLNENAYYILFKPNIHNNDQTTSHLRKGAFKTVKNSGIMLQFEDSKFKKANRVITLSAYKIKGKQIKNKALRESDIHKDLAKEGYTVINFKDTNCIDRTIYIMPYKGENLLKFNWSKARLEDKNEIIKKIISKIMQEPTKYFDIKAANILYDNSSDEISIIDYTTKDFTFVTSKTCQYYYNINMRQDSSIQNEQDDMNQRILNMALVFYYLYENYMDKIPTGLIYNECPQESLKLNDQNKFAQILQNAYKNTYDTLEKFDTEVQAIIGNHYSQNSLSS